MLNVKSAKFVAMNAKLLIQGHLAAMAISFLHSAVAMLIIKLQRVIKEARVLFLATKLIM